MSLWWAVPFWLFTMTLLTIGVMNVALMFAELWRCR